MFFVIVVVVGVGVDVGGVVCVTRCRTRWCESL